MIRLRNLSLRTKLVVFILLISATSLGLSNAVLAIHGAAHRREAMIRDLSVLCDIIGATSSPALATRDRAAAEQALSVLSAKQPIVAAEIFDAQGQRFAAYLRQDAPDRALQLGRDSFFDGILSREKGIVLQGERLGSIRIYADSRDLHATLLGGLALTGLAMLAALGCAFLLSLALASVITKPVLRLAQIAERVSREANYSLRAEPGGRDEIGGLIDGFNGMLGQIQQRDLALLAHRDQLEDKVGQRTLELTELNAELIEARDRAEAAARSKAQFLANMSHEIRTPMNGVLGMLELLLDSGLSEPQLRLAGAARTSGETLLGIINEILDISKIEANAVELEHIAFDPRRIIEDMVELLGPRAYNKGLELVPLLSPSVPSEVMGDPARVRQVLINLMGNAIKFTERGEVTIELSGEHQAGNRVLLEFAVRDTGIGIPEAAQQHIFDAFSQADGSTTRRFGGTGLGLSIAKRLTEMMQGTIRLRSAPGAGATFVVRIAFALAASVRAAAASEPELPRHRLLIAARNASYRRLLETWGKAWDLECASVSSRAATLEALRSARANEQPYHALCLDRRLDEGDGLELAARIDDTSLGDLRVLLIESVDQLGCVEDAALPTCVRARLTKPFRVAELRSALARVLGAEAPVHVAPPASVPRRFDARVLVAEDNPVNQAVACRMLQKLGCEVVVVPNGRQAVEKATSEPFDLILMDCQMPEMDGYEATSILRHKERDGGGGDRIPIVAVTAHALEGDREKCMRAGMDDYMTKPISGERLALMLAAWLDPERVAADHAH